MLTNSDMTIYRRIRNSSDSADTWERIYVEKVWWFSNANSQITSSGLKSADVLTVRIPDTSVIIKKGDYILKGNISVAIKTVKDLADYEYYCVTAANYNMYGDEPHIKVVGT